MAAMALVGALGLTSCDNETNDTQMITGYCTVEGSNPNYTFLMDGGGTVEPTPSSITEITGGKGMPTQRALVYIEYEKSDFIEVAGSNDWIIKNGEMKGGAGIEIGTLLSKSQAEQKNLLAADSIFKINKLNNCWAWNGYLNVSINGYYSYQNSRTVRPSFEVMVAETAENLMKLKVLYNRHSSKDAAIGGDVDLIKSYNIRQWLMGVPGKDSVTIEINVEDGMTKKLKTSRH